MPAMVAEAVERAGALAADGDREEAARVLERYLEGAPGDAFAHFQLANLLLSMGHPATAVECLERALTLQPHNPLVHNDLELRDDMPWQISRHHVAFVVSDGKVGVVDRGSKLGTAVDGRRLGGRAGEPGPLFFSSSEGTLLLGNEKSPYEFRVTIEASR